MMKFFLGDFGRRWKAIEDTAHVYESIANREGADRQLEPNEFHHLAEIEANLRFVCRSLDLKGASEQALQFSTDLEHKKSSLLTVSHALNNLILKICREAGEKLLVYIPPDRAKYFNQQGDKPLFERSVLEKFPSAAYDISAAGNCLAADLGNAAIFHLMRTVEYGLRALAKDVKVPVSDEDLEYLGWKRIIEQIYAEVKKLTDSASGSSKNKSELREYYNGIMSEFSGFKDVWRNNIMHTRGIYTTEEAKSVFERVQKFMQRLAKRIGEVS